MNKRITRHGAIAGRRIVCFIMAALIASALGFAAAEAECLVPVGRTVGISINSEGVVIVGIPDKCSDNKADSPGKAAGFQIGDIIIKFGSADIHSCEDLKHAAAAFKGGPAAVHVVRSDGTHQIEVFPQKMSSGEYSLGLWVRDGISGIGTVTFYNPATGGYGALGHSVSDTDTGIMLPVRSGAISRSAVADVQKGKTGTPGQLHGQYNFEDKLGTITENTKSGIFGKAETPFEGTPFETAGARELHTGVAYILSNVAGSEVRKYSIEITRVYGNSTDGRDMLITVTDPALLDATGGIVQGMSGSPILQDGKLAGAVTHVLINDPTRGYGVSIERMLAAGK